MSYIDVEHGYFTPAQSDLNWAQTFRMTNRAPGFANRIFDTLEHLEAYINDTSSKASATPGLVVTVISDESREGGSTNNNGVYKINSVKTVASDPVGTYEKLNYTIRTVTNITTDLSQDTENNLSVIKDVTTGEYYIFRVYRPSSLSQGFYQYLINKDGYKSRRGVMNGSTPHWWDWTEERYEVVSNNVYVHELKLVDMGIRWGGSHGIMTYVPGEEITIGTTTYGKWLDDLGDYYYTKVMGQVIDENGGLYFYVFVYNETYSTMQQTTTLQRNAIVPLNVAPVYVGLENSSNTQFHLYNGNTDTYYVWDDIESEYVALDTHIVANKFYVWQASAFDASMIFKITLTPPTDSNIKNEYLFQISVGATVPKIKSPGMPNAIYWTNDPNLLANNKYQFHVLNYVGWIAGKQYVGDYLPTSPTEDGTYKLQCVVTGGVPDHIWTEDFPAMQIVNNSLILNTVSDNGSIVVE